MADSSGQDAYGQAVGDARGTTGLIKEADEVFGAPIRRLFQRRAAEKALIQDLGDWAAEAKDSNGRWLRPILTATSFGRHLEAHDAHFKPAATCTSRFGWARLLFALDVRPRAGVLQWELPTIPIDPCSIEGIVMDMDGEVLCHIINLYRIYKECDPRRPTEFSGSEPFETSFGDITIVHTETANRFIVEFESRPITELQQERIPFRYYNQRSELRDYLHFDRDTVMTRYAQLALTLGVSDAAWVLPSGSEKSLPERTRELVNVLKLIGASRNDKPFLITPAWLESASRIYRRITTGAGEQTTLAKEIVAGLREQFESLFQTEEFFSSSSRDIDWFELVEIMLGVRCLRPDQSLKVSWDTSTRTPQLPNILVYDLMKKEFGTLMSAFAAAPAGTFRHALAEVPDAAKFVLQHKPEIACFTGGVVLEFTSQSSLWNASCRVKC